MCISVSTTDWSRVNDFCRNPKISGKAFAEHSTEELEALAAKLRKIKRTGWQRKGSLLKNGLENGMTGMN